ncbi:MAG TPA: hypothetical protein VG603_06660, partial [Chitinophagales bacterium]|nr:hypothetical protein [Chitinophagales bacterium]
MELTALFLPKVHIYYNITLVAMNHCHLDQLLRMKNYEDLINEANNYRAKIYYNLTELQEKTGLCIRALKYRMKEVKQKYQNIPMLLHKKRHAWCIHESIIY